MDRNDIIDESLSILVTRTHSVLNRRLIKNFKEADHPITPEQYAVLLHLWEEDGMCQISICGLTGKDKPGVTRIIDNLEKSGFVVRKPSEEDRRKKLIYLTPDGKCLKEASNKLAVKTLEEMLENIDKEEIQTTKDTLIKVIKKYDEFGDC